MPVSMSPGDLADALGAHEQVVHEIVTERAPVTHLMASKLARHFSTMPAFWIKLQSSHDRSNGITISLVRKFA